MTPEEDSDQESVLGLFKLSGLKYLAVECSGGYHMTLSNENALYFELECGISPLMSVLRNKRPQ